jgi:hypothetical protein
LGVATRLEIPCTSFTMLKARFFQKILGRIFHIQGPTYHHGRCDFILRFFCYRIVTGGNLAHPTTMAHVLDRISTEISTSLGAVSTCSIDELTNKKELRSKERVNY